MATFVSAGPNMFGALAFGQPDQRTLNYLENQFADLSPTLSQAGNAFIERSRAIFEQFNGAEAMRLAKAALRTVQHAFRPDHIQTLTTIGELQQAPPAMQRWIMAQPEVRYYYSEQRCDGYADTYLDREPGAIGVDHTDWRLVNSGVIHDLPDSKDGEGDWKATVYYEDDENEVRLTLSDKVDIFNTWDAIASMMKPGDEDPTSPFAAKM